MTENDLNDWNIADAVKDVTWELRTAMGKFKPFNSAHEGFAILKEEVDELWEDVRKGNLHGAREEAIQVAAMALRFVIDVGEQEKMDNHRDS